MFFCLGSWSWLRVSADPAGETVSEVLTKTWAVKCPQWAVRLRGRLAIHKQGNSTNGVCLGCFSDCSNLGSNSLLGRCDLSSEFSYLLMERDVCLGKLVDKDQLWPKCHFRQSACGWVTGCLCFQKVTFSSLPLQVLTFRGEMGRDSDPHFRLEFSTFLPSPSLRSGLQISKYLLFAT